MRDTGVGIYDPLFFIGVVENNVDERLESRVQVRAFGVHGTVDQIPTEKLPWATLIHGSYDPNSMLPPINSFVFGFFIDGRDAQQPMILGLIPTQMTEVLDPAVTGWGKIPTSDMTLLAKGSTPEDFGQPLNSRLGRGEDIDKTYVLLQQMNRTKDIPIASDSMSTTNETIFEEPAPAYNAQYPYNRVIETASHSIELDDTPGAERIMIHHKSGSYVSIDSRGTTVQKSMSDKYEINDTHQHVYVGGKSYVTILGDSHVLVKGNKVEEIVGDYVQVVHGNHMISVGGQMNLNASDEVQMRAAKIRIDSNVEGINIKASKGVNIESGSSSVHIKSGVAIFQEAKNSINTKAGDNMFIETGSSFNIKSDSMFLEATGAGDFKAGHAKIGGGTKVSISADIVAVDDLILLADGQSMAPVGAGNVTGADGAASTELPEPAAKSTSTTGHRNNSSIGSAGYASQDDGSVKQNNSSISNPSSKKLTDAEVSKILAGPEVDLARAQAEGFLGRPMSDTEWNNLVAATIAESLQNSPQEQAAVMSVILNRVKSDKYPNTVTDVLLQTSQFQSVTGTNANPGPSSAFSNPSQRQVASTVSGVNQYLGTMDKGWLNFTSNIDAAYGAGTNIGFKGSVTNSGGSQIIGGTVFGTV